MTLSANDIRPGDRFVAKDGMAITPHEIIVRVVWVDEASDAVHYQKENSGEPIKQTGIARFAEIVSRRAPTAD